MTRRSFQNHDDLVAALFEVFAEKVDNACKQMQAFDVDRTVVHALQEIRRAATETAKTLRGGNW